MEELRNKLFQLINEASKSLPPEAVYYICKDFYREINDDYHVYLSQRYKQKFKNEAQQQKEE